MTETLVRNIPLLEETMQFVMDHPRRHNQGKWICGTTACYAGHALLLSGLTQREVLNLDVCEGPGLERTSRILLEASRRLGIDRREAGILFGAHNTVPMLQAMVKDLVNGEILRPYDSYSGTDFVGGDW